MRRTVAFYFRLPEIKMASFLRCSARFVVDVIRPHYFSCRFLKEDSRFLKDRFSKPVTEREKHAGELKTLKDVMEELNRKDPELDRPRDIGFPLKAVKIVDGRAERLQFQKQARLNRELEKAARTKTLKVPLDDVYASWASTEGPSHIRCIAEHYGIFNDFFRGAHFNPVVPMDITFDYDAETVTKVYRGNHIQPSEATFAPVVRFNAAADSLWTLVLSNPDGHFEDENAEYLHWFVGNIPANDVGKGEVLCDYLQPFPAKGTGFHRFVFVLYRQEGPIDYSSLRRTSPCLRLRDRTFVTFDFYKERQDVLTPAGLAFFQSEWDETLTDFFHKTLLMREPVFEYDFPPPYIRPQTIKPKYVSFNMYLEKYRDPKDIEKEILLKRLKAVHPFHGERPRPKYPCIYPYPAGMPQWLKTETWKERMRIGKYRGLDVTIFKPDRYVWHYLPRHRAAERLKYKEINNPKM